MVKDVFFSYSDWYIKRKQPLYSCEIMLDSFSQTETCVLVRYFSSLVSDYVPFYKLLSIAPSTGVLLDLYESLPNLNSCRQSKPTICENKNLYFPITSPVNAHRIRSYPSKCYSSYYCRNSCYEVKKPKANLDLDEIVPVIEDIFPRENRRHANSEADILILDPLLLEYNPRKRVKIPLTESEQNKIARITITYILAFFALILFTYFIIYLA